MKRVFYFVVVALLSFQCSIDNGQNRDSANTESPEGRFEYELNRLKDPATGKIPEGIKFREMAFSHTLPQSSGLERSGAQVYEPIGPYNVGGRTRALAFDQENPDIILAGGVSGGMWRSTDGGQSWNRTTSSMDISSVSCVTQDVRSGKTDIWYYGTGETRGNSASKSSSASYNGNGVFKSTDNGQTWTQLTSTSTEPQTFSTWSAVFTITTDPSRNDSDIVLASTESGIMRSNDGGDSWKNVLSGGFTTDWSEVVGTSSGIFYAHISGSDNSAGIYRSTDGMNWLKISPSNFPNNQQRGRLAIAPSNENIVYFFCRTPGAGQNIDPSEPNSESNSFWRYRFLSGDGTGSNGEWLDRSSNLPQSTEGDNQLNTFNNYCMSLAVKPDNEDVVFIGGTNLFRTTDGFASSSNTAQLGGYDAQGYNNYRYIRDGQHPDQHNVKFMPGNPDVMLASSDGGIHKTEDCLAFKVIWEDLNNGYITSQFYAVGTVHDAEIPLAAGGTQDNGTWFTNTSTLGNNWEKARGADGAYTALTNGGATAFISTQYANIQRTDMDPITGNVLNRENIMPNFQWASYSFVHPFTLDPKDRNKMYLPIFNELYKNVNLASPFVKNNWSQVADLSINANIKAIGVAHNEDVVYVGTDAKQIYRIDNANSNSTVSSVTNNISSGNYTSSIAVDPRDANKAIVVYSNYNVVSLWYTEDGGQSWTDIEGNLKGTAQPGIPDNLQHLSDGPSCRWAEIVPTQNGDSSIYLVGTSIGLFAATELDGDSTSWVQQGTQTIGNVVVDMIDVRLSDGYTVVGTHGNGVYSTTLNMGGNVGLADQSAYEKEIDYTLYPNPAKTNVNISFELQQSERVKIEVYNMNGQRVLTEKKLFNSGKNNQQLNVNNLTSGNYLVQLTGESFNIGKIMTVQ
ncbi:T9SS type A sorting domain-containing protein [Salibacter halophilus]|uniref:T9SS type A sorting domain-containing protein n=1 Tax=Salibacter halophilus TaxID=1803916 RepID=A0A6N6M511_9FLAO|nr:T9SS type A sorting domain-containing protein [Salibacter halophilus]KAB1064707.1 T9SS type A sorting domain-containing protein [Salibacter halophilus]